MFPVVVRFSSSKSTSPPAAVIVRSPVIDLTVLLFKVVIWALDQGRSPVPKAAAGSDTKTVPASRASWVIPPVW